MNRETAVRFLTTKVAKIIYDTVSCDLPSRAESDWNVAEILVALKFRNIVQVMLMPRVKYTTDPIHKHQEALPENCSYEDFDRVMGFLVWTQTQPLRCLLPSPPYGRITFY
jgi:hypothetical protein